MTVAIDTPPLEPAFTPIGAIPGIVAGARAAFDAGRTRPVAWRRAQLAAVERLVAENEGAIHGALRADLGKPEVEAYTAESSFVARHAAYVAKHLDGWMVPRRVPTPMLSQPGTSAIRPEPLGVAAVIAPWNYPFHLAMLPVVGALAAGNAVVLKPSEVSAATAAMLAELVPRYLDDAVRVVTGGVDETTALLRERFDHVFYTGNGAVGRIVMRAAAEHLTPVTLELGGKSPCLVDRTADLDDAARRIAFGKFSNAGQTCVAPDYVLAHRDVAAGLVEKLGAAVRAMYGDDPRRSPDYGRIVNARHHRRLVALLEGQSIAFGGDHDARDRYLAPTVIRDPDPASPVMDDEIFGPILPVIAVDSIEAAITHVNARPKPLALYVFTGDGGVADAVLDRTSSGAAVVNHVWMHLLVPELPFGGVGESGMGAYHGRHSFDTFSHLRAVLRKPAGWEPSVVYPPYDDGKKRWIRRLL